MGLYNASVSNVVFLVICKLYICIQNVFGHIFYSSRLHLYRQFWQFEVQKLTYMLILAAGGSSPYLSSVGGGVKTSLIFKVISWDLDVNVLKHISMKILL